MGLDADRALLLRVGLIPPNLVDVVDGGCRVSESDAEAFVCPLLSDGRREELEEVEEGGMSSSLSCLPTPEGA